MSFLITLGLLFAIVICGSPLGMTTMWGHLGSAIIVFASLHKLSKTYLFWSLILLTTLSASHPRFSLEYILIAFGFLSLGLHGWWLKRDLGKRKIILAVLFVILFVMNYFHVGLHERGSLLLWLPVFVILYFDKLSAPNTFAYAISGVMLFYSNKKTSFLAWLTSLVNYFGSRIAYAFGFLALIAVFFFRGNLMHFWRMAMEPRLYIWYSSLKGFLHSPLWGHGFGTYSIEFPVYRVHSDAFGTKLSQQIVHGHNLFAHLAFELGLVGLLLIFILFYLVYKHCPRALLPLLTISFFDSSIAMFNQYAMFGLVLLPFLLDKGDERIAQIFSPLPEKIASKAKYLAYIVAAMVFVPSIMGHGYYKLRDYDKAIKWDSQHSLYHFMRGAMNLHKDAKQSEVDLKRAVELSPNISYFYGFLAASELANSNIEDAQISSAKALRYDGEDGYWYLLSAFAHYYDQGIYKDHFAKAIELNPEIEELIHDPSISASEYIGSRKADARVSAFYRRGPKVYLPLPYVE